jgi:hypothetical protein
MFVHRTAFLIALFFFMLSFPCQGQNDSLPGLDMTFTRYLIDNNQYREAEFVIDKYLAAPEGLQFIDTARYLKGIINYQQMKLGESADYFSKVSPTSGYFQLSRFLAGYEFAHLNDTGSSRQMFLGVAPSDSLLLELKNFQLASLSLLNKDLNAYRNYSGLLTYNYFQLKDQEDAVADIYNKTVNFKEKSPLLAGTMSAIIPGTGKMYAGKLGEGVTALLGLGILGAITYENYVKAGPRNVKTITFGSLFGIFYVSNIYGSVYSVKVYRDEYYKSVRNAILFNMHIPIRNIFKDSFK